MWYVARSRIALFALFVVLAGWTCADGTVHSNPGGGSSEDSSVDAPDTGNDTTRDTTNGGGSSLKSVAIEPKSVTLTSKNGSQPTETFDVIATYTDGQSGRYTGEVEFSIADRTIGTMKPKEGKFTASGTAGGTTEVTAKLPDEEDFGALTAEVTVQVERVVEVGSLPNDYKKKFGSPTTDPNAAPNVVYPLNGAVMPQSVFPADIQWTRGAQGDLFKVELSKQNATVTAYLQHTGS